jgi:hypothetical protein
MRSHVAPFALLLTVCCGTLARPAAAQLSADWMVPAAAHAAGESGTFWRTDLSLHNPHAFELPVVVQALESNRDNSASVPTLTVALEPYETLNLWDALGPDLFDLDGTAALLVYADRDLPCDPLEECDLLVTSRTYTAVPGGGAGEYGQGIPGRTVGSGVDWWTYGYAAGVMNDGVEFRCNAGVASWTPDWTTVRVDVQDAGGSILATESFDLPPFGHVQRRLQTAVAGGSLVFYLAEGPDEALVYPYASVVNQATGDPSFVAVEPSVVGVPVGKGGRPAAARPAVPQPAVPAVAWSGPVAR